MTHTPGPYEIVTGDIGDEFVCIVLLCLRASNGKAIISNNGGLAPDDEEWNVDELFANAHLFAATPDMLAALLAHEREIQLNDICSNRDPSASLEWMAARDEAVAKCAAVLKRLRDAGVIAKAEESA